MMGNALSACISQNSICQAVIKADLKIETSSMVDNAISMVVSR
jgi:hypothetical protein